MAHKHRLNGSFLLFEWLPPGTTPGTNVGGGGTNAKATIFKALRMGGDETPPPCQMKGVPPPSYAKNITKYVIILRI